MELRRRILAVAACVVSAFATPAIASPSGVVISQFRFDGPSGASDEFIELHNTGSNAVNIGGWQLQGCASGSGAASTRATIAANTQLAAGAYFLFTNSTSGTGYSGTVTGDQTYGTGISNSGKSGIRLLDTGNVAQDGLGLSGSVCAEGTALSSIAGSSPNFAYVRKNNGSQDTDNNAADFSGPSGAGTPHNNAGSGPVVCTNVKRIYQIQGAGHVSPERGNCVTGVPGIVTALTSSGFYMQDGDGDGNPATSDGIYVFTSSTPTVHVGDIVSVAGTVSEYRSGSTFGATNCPATSGACNLSTTEIDAPTVTSAAPGTFTNSTITPTVIGEGGRIPPSQNIDAGSSASVEDLAHVFDPSSNGIDFFESLEGMLVQVNNARAVGPTDKFGEIWVVADNGADATGVNQRGGVTLVNRTQGLDSNPERIQLDLSALTSTYPQVNVGDTVSQVVGTLSYDFANYRLFPTSLPSFVSGGLGGTISTVSSGASQLRVVTYNLENLNANENDVCDGAPDTAVANGRFAREGTHIAVNLGAPDILAVEEIQDSSGCTDDGVVEPSLTLSTLINAISAAGGPTYSYVEIDPVNDQDGGLPGGNIRQVFLYNPARVSFVGGVTGAGDATTATALSLVNGQLALSLSPGRVKPNDSAWASSRKPLAATFEFNGRRVLIVANHLNSKGGDEPLFGRFQPPVLSSATQRVQQAQIVHDFVQQALALQTNARVIVLGDLNDFDFSTPLQVLSGDSVGTPILFDLAAAKLAPEERYSYVYQGNSQELDHIYVSQSLLANAEIQPIHVNSEFANQVSDHDPSIASFPLPANRPPQANAGSAQTVNSGVTVTLDGSASSDADGSIASYSWSQTSGTPVTLNNANAAQASFVSPASGTLVFQLTVTDNEGASASASVTITVGGDTTPNAFTIAPVTGVEPGSTQTSSAFTVTGINADTPIAVSNGSVNINNSGFVASGTVHNNDSVVVRAIASTLFATTKLATVTIGGVSADFSVTTRAANTTPTPFSFTPKTNVAPGRTAASNSVLITGIEAPASVSMSNARLCVNTAPPCPAMAPATVNNGDLIQLQVTASNSANTLVSGAVTIGGVTGTFNVTTTADASPDPFQFAALSDQVANQLVSSNTIVVSGLSGPTGISLVPGAGKAQFSINGAAFQGAAAVVRNGDQVQLRQFTAAKNGVGNRATLTIGDVSADWLVTTADGPSSLRFVNKLDQNSGALVASNSVTLSGLGGPIAISISGTGAQYRVNGGAYTSAAGTVNNGDRVNLQLRSGDLKDAVMTAVLTIGSQTASWSVTTGTDTTPDGLRFNPRTAAPGTVLLTASPIVKGISVPVAISIGGDASAMYRINGGSFSNQPGMVNPGDQIQLQLTAPASGSSASANLSVGTLDTSWTVSAP